MPMQTFVFNMSPPEYYSGLRKIKPEEWLLTSQLLLAGAAIGTDGSLWMPTDVDKHVQAERVSVTKEDVYNFMDGSAVTPVRREYRVPTVWTCVHPVPQTRTYVYTFDGIMSTIPSERSKYLWCPSKCPKTLADFTKAVADDIDAQQRIARDMLRWEEGNRG